jgi:hypothetical protein
LLSAFLSTNLSCSFYRGAKTSPFGGSTAAVGDRGAFPRAEGAVVWFFLARKSGLPVFPGRSPVVKVLFILAPQAPTTTLGPMGPSNLRTLSAAGAVNLKNPSPPLNQPASCGPNLLNPRAAPRPPQSAFFLFYHIYKHKRTAAVQAAVLFVRFLTWRRKYPPPHHIPHPSAVRRPLRRFRPCRFWRG